MLHTHQLSSGAGAVGQTLADVPSELSLTPLQETKETYTDTSCLISDVDSAQVLGEVLRSGLLCWHVLYTLRMQ
jgi:hypothetical protein